jgi:probable metal-binding protein
MDQTIHAHDVLNILKASATPLSTAELHNQAAACFGAGATYTNCRGDRFSFDELIAFLVARGKVAEEGGQLSLIPAELCDHR